MKEKNFASRMKIGNTMRSDVFWMSERLCCHLLNFVTIDIMYSLLFSYYLGEVKVLFISTLILLLLPFGVDSSIVLPLVLAVRFCSFTYFYGLEKCDTFLIVIVLYLELLLSKVEVRIRYALPPFLVVVIGASFLDFLVPCSIPDFILNKANIVTRIYVLTYLTIRACHAKYVSIGEEKKHSDQANMLRKLEEDELGFYNRFSHFSRTCLNGIVNFVGFLRSSYDNLLETTDDDDGEHNMHNGSNATRCFDTVEISASEIFRQSSELVEYVELRNHEEEQINTEAEITDVDEVLDYVHRVQSKLRLEGDRKKKKRVKFVVLTSRGRRLREYPRYMRFSPQCLSRILMNIISNALKYTEKGSVRVSVHETGKRELEIVVKDTGIGIQKELLERIFKPFVKNNTGKQSFSIGMVITKSLVEKAGGRIEVKSAGKDMGTEVRVCLPLEVPDEKEVKAFRVDHSPFRSCSKMKKKKKEEEKDEDVCFEGVTDVLVVEDNEINQKVFVRHVEMIINRNRSRKKKVKVHVARDGLEALSLLPSLANRNPLVITDIDMPRCDGFEFVRRVRERTSYGRSLVIYAVTASIIGDKKTFCSKYGFDGVESKPVYLNRMISVLKFMAEERKKKIIEQAENEERTRVIEHRLSKVHPVAHAKEEDEEQKNEKRVVTIENDEYVKIRTSVIGLIALTTIASALYYQPFSPIPEEFKWGWGLFIQLNLSLHLLLYFLMYIFRFSTEVMSLCSLGILFLGTVFNSEFTHFKVNPLVNVFHFSFIMQANESLERFKSALAFSLAFFFKSVYYELTRPGDYFSTYQSVPFLYFLPCFSLVFFLIKVLVMSHSFVSIREERRRKWKERIDEMLSIEKDYNLTSSKVSHDLATPASALVLNLEEMREHLKEKSIIEEFHSPKRKKRNRQKSDHLKSKISSCFVTLLRCAFELELSIHNFLACCKIRNGMVVTDLVPEVYFASFIKSIVKRYSILLLPRKKGRKKFEFACKIDPRLYRSFPRTNDVPLCVDMVNIHLIVSNLLFNAICHSKTSRKIELSCQILSIDDEENRGVMEICIKDYGVGIDQKHLEKFRSDEYVTEKLRFREMFSNTLGLGLVVCRRISSLMKTPSRVTITSSERNEEDDRKGTTARFQFPFKCCHQSKEEEPEEEEDDDEKNRRRSTAYSLRNRDIRSIRVLCVDDDVILGNFIRMFLLKMGFSRDLVMVETHENEAIKHMKSQKFDLLISDLNLVNMQFPEMISLVPKKWIPKIVICATGSPEDFHTGRNKELLGRKNVVVRAVVTKPIVFDSLRNTLRRFVQVRE